MDSGITAWEKEGGASPGANSPKDWTLSAQRIDPILRGLDEEWPLSSETPSCMKHPASVADLQQGDELLQHTVKSPIAAPTLAHGL
jgi:hypothetical protein